MAFLLVPEVLQLQAQSVITELQIPALLTPMLTAFITKIITARLAIPALLTAQPALQFMVSEMKEKMLQSPIPGRSIQVITPFTARAQIR